MRDCTTLICIYDYPAAADQFYKKIKHIYAFNYKHDDKKPIDNNILSQIGNYIKKHPVVYEEWIKLVYKQVLDILDEDEKLGEDERIGYNHVILAQLERNAINDMDRRTFKLDDISKILNEHSGLDVIDLLCRHPSIDNYGFIIRNGHDINNNYNYYDKFVIEHEPFRVLDVPKLIYEKLNRYVMTTYVVHIEFLYINDDEKYVQPYSYIGYPFRLPSTLSKYETEVQIGKYIKDNIDIYEKWTSYMRIGLQFKLLDLLYDKMYGKLTREGGVYLNKHNYLLQKYVSVDEDEDGDPIPYIDFEVSDIEKYITDVINDNHEIYELMFGTYGTVEIKFYSELLDLTNNARYATID